jgi:hypothetical protein
VWGGQPVIQVVFLIKQFKSKKGQTFGGMLQKILNGNQLSTAKKNAVPEKACSIIRPFKGGSD